MNLNIDLDDKRLSKQQIDQLNRIMPKKRLQDQRIGALEEQMRLIGDQYVHMGFAVDQMKNSKTSDGYALKLQGISIHYKDKKEPLAFLEKQRKSIGDQITTLKRNLQLELKQKKELENKYIDIYEKLNNVKIPRPENEKIKFKKDGEQANKEFKSIERQLEKDMGEICRT